MDRRTFLLSSASSASAFMASGLIPPMLPRQPRSEAKRFPVIPHERLIKMLNPPTDRVEVLLDTDTHNEIDDQFALAYALLSRDRLDLKAICAAPFHNNRSRDAADGMEQSYQEINRVQQMLPESLRVPAFRGSRQFLSSETEPVRSPAAELLVEMAEHTGTAPLYVSAIGTLTNVASAILIKPEIIHKIVVVWTSAYPHTWHRPNRSFNLQQDLHAARVTLDSGVPLVYLPGFYVGEELRVTLPEVRQYLRGHGLLGDYLYEIYENYFNDHFGRSKVIWDLINVAWLIHPGWVPSDIYHTPELLDDLRWGPQDDRRPVMREAHDVDRDAVFSDFYRKVQQLA